MELCESSTIAKLKDSTVMIRGILATKLDLEVLAQADSSTHLHNAASLLAAASVGLAGASNFMLTPLDRA